MPVGHLCSAARPGLKIGVKNNMPLGSNNLLRRPYPSELDFFQKNPKVTGMATEDNRVIINPYSTLNENEQQALVDNESARILIRTGKIKKPDFSVTKEQQKFLDSTTYKDASEEDRRATIAARLLTGDPTAGVATKEQKAYVDMLRKMMLEGKK